MKYHFQSPRLSLRPYTEADFHYAFRMQSDPEIMHFIRPAVQDESVVRERTSQWLTYASANPGYGVWVIEGIENQEFVGYGVVRHVEFTPGREVEIGYIIAKEHWGKGLATESARALMDYAVREHGVEALVAYTNENNHASNKVLEKCGFSSAGMELVYGEPCLRWVWKKGQEK